MSETNVDVVRWVYEQGLAQRRVDIPGLDDRVAPNYRFHPRPGFPGRATYRRDELPALWADLDETFIDHSLAPTGYEAVGTHVLATLEQTARLRGSDQELAETVFQLWLFANGKIQETWTFTDKSEALKAAGLSE